MKRILLLVGALIIAAAVFLVYQRIGEGRQAVDFSSASERRQVGEISFRSLDREFSLSDFRGKIVLVDVWATWCGPCIAAIPKLISLQDQFEGDLVVLGLNVDEGGWPVLEAFLARRSDIDYLVARPEPPAEILFNTLIDVPPLGKVSALPTVFLLDRQGRLVSKYVGATPKQTLQGDIQRLLAD
ncbi:MAG TPA: TlpA disulfide reductase family protein [Acidobacteriota bacterium]|nr:TlpA disulfide reductase family protein [Acidobacteriota bacterium]